MQKPRQHRIKDLLQQWAAWQSISSTIAGQEMPAEVAILATEIDKLAPTFRRVVALEYLDSRPQKTKAALIGIPRESFSMRVRFIHEQLDFAVFSM